MQKRKEETGLNKAWYRSDRFIEHDGNWFFLTREGTTEGPFDTRAKASLMLEKWIQVQNSGLLNTDTNELTLEPLVDSKPRSYS